MQKHLLKQGTGSRKAWLPDRFSVKWLMILAALYLPGFAGSLLAQTSVQIGTGTDIAASTLYGPVYRYSSTSTTNGARTNMLWTAAEMAAAGIPSGAIITKIEFNKANTANFNGNVPFKMLVANTSNTALNTTDTWASILQTHTQVINNTAFNLPATTGWVPFTFSAPFNYTGGAFEVATEHSVASLAQPRSTDKIQWEFTSGHAGKIVGVSDPNGATLSGTVTGYKERPNIRITFTSNTCTSPPIAGATESSANIVCPNTSFNLSLNGNSIGVGLTFQWQSSPNGTTWSNIPGAESVTFTTSQTTTNYYRAVLTCSGSSTSSTPVQVFTPAILSGTYTIDKRQATNLNTRTFASFKEAVDIMTCVGINAATTFNVASGSGPYNEQVVIPAITGASASNRITFNGNGNTIGFNATVTGARHIFKLDGADFITLNNFVIDATDGSYGWGIHLINEADNNNITNNIINSSLTSATSSAFAGIVATNSTSTVGTAGNNANNTTISGNTVSGGYHAISLSGNGTTAPAIGNVITSNTVKNGYIYHIHLEDQDGTQVSGNDIHRMDRGTVSSFYAVYVTGASRNILIQKNKMHDGFTASPGSTSVAYPLYFTSADALVGQENKVINNLIYNINTNGTIYGMYNSGSDGVYYYHNTISLDNTANTGTMRGFYQTTAATNIKFINNIVAMNTGTAGVKHAIYFGTNATGIESNNNVLYLTGGASGSGIGYLTSNRVTLADWTAATGDDANSVSSDPLFVDAANGNFIPTSSDIDNIGRNVGVTTDFDGGAARSTTTPDAGAFEFSPPTLDAGVIAISPLPTPVAPGVSTPIEVTIQNFGLDPIYSVTISYKVDGGTATTYNYTNASGLASGATDTKVIGNYAFSAGSHTLEAFTSKPNGIIDANAANNSTTISVYACSPLAGAKTIGGTAGPNNFASFTDAVEALKICGVSGAVTFTAMGNATFNEQIEIPAITGASASNTITFDGAGRTLSFDPTVSAARYVIRLNGADHVTIKNLNIETTGTGTSAYGWGIHFINGADNNTILNNTITIGSTSTTESNSAGIVFSNSNTTATTTGNNGNNNVISGNTITGGYKGVGLYGLSTSTGANQILNNSVQDVYATGIELGGAYATLVEGNNISRPTRTTVGTFEGITLSGATQNSVITKNRIHNTHGGASSLSGQVNGIYSSSNDAPVGKENIVSNNLIYNINNTGTIYALYNSGSAGVFYYHNTVHLNNTANTGTNRGFYQTTAATNIRIINNMITIAGGTTGAKHALYFGTTTSGITSNRNNLYLTGGSSSSGVGFYSSNQATLANWKTANGGAYDQNSISEDPDYVTTAGGDNLKPNSPAVNNLGQNLLTVVPQDVLNVNRTTTPDMGAYEFTPPATADAGITAILSPGISLAPGTNAPIQVTLKNFGGAPLTSATVKFSINGTVIGSPFNFTQTPGLATNASTTITIGNYTFATGGTYTLRAFTELPNGTTDIDPTNNFTEITISVCSPLSGTKTIGGTPAANNYYATFTDAVKALVDCGVSGPVTFNVAAGTYNEQITIPEITGASATNRITFNGNGRTIGFTSANTNQRAVIKLDGADYITLNNLVIDATSGTYGWGIHLTNGANNNTITNNTINSSLTSTLNNFSGIVASGSNTAATTDGVNASNTTITGNTVNGGYYGIILVGNGATGQAIGNTVMNNTVKNFYNYGIYSDGQNGTVISGNDIHRLDRASASLSSFYGIYGTTSKNLLIEKNKIHDPFANNNASTSLAYGIYFTTNDAAAGSENKVINNLIYNIKNNGLAYGIYNSGSDGAYYYHNTIDLNHPANTSTVRGFYQTTAATNIVFKNNNVTVTGGTTGVKHAIYFGTNATGIVSDNNNLYLTGGASGSGIGYLTSNRVTLADWTTATSDDANSVSGDPGYVSAATGNLKPTSGILNNKGANVGVTTDFTGASRNATTPDPGAYEFNAPSCVAGQWTGAVSTDWTNAGNWCGGILPTLTTDVLIPAGTPFSPVISSNQSVRNITINTFAKLTISGVQLKVYGTYVNNGNLVDGTGVNDEIAFVGTSVQTLGGSGSSVINKLNVGAAGVNLGGPVSIKRAIVLNGNLATNGHKLTLLSNADGTAMVVNNSFAVTGTVTVQRHIDNSLNSSIGYRHYSSPVQNTTLADLATGGYTPVVNPAYNNAVKPGLVRPFPNVFAFDESRLNSDSARFEDFGFGWESPASTSSPMRPGHGYSVNTPVRTVDFNGTLNNGTVNVGTLTRGATANSGWHLLGNPYPSPMDWDQVTKPAGMMNAVYTFRSDSRYGGSYASYVNGVGNLTGGVIPAMQGFFVRVSSTVSGFSFSNADRVTNYTNPSFYKTAETRPLVQLNLSNAKGLADELFIYQEAGATVNDDAAFDAYKVQPNSADVPTLYAITPNGKSLAINGVPVLSQETIIPLGFYVGAAGTYTFEPAQLLNQETGAEVYLEDRQTGTLHNLRTSGNYTCQLVAGSNATRFALRLKPAAKAVNPVAVQEARLFPNPTSASKGFTLSVGGLTDANLKVMVYNQVGQLVESRTIEAVNGMAEAQFSTRNLAKGIYSLKVVSDNFQTTKKVIVQ
ncbi:CARDB domain-containing protein [Adhaeribacter soli]|uniref:T9SS type A sorting domain-containing protein n=1 Tax=Adhaeribacter soli TaxID=2607655 RepID=A0A5N1IH34_9BACT|nr:CARDB domain-containing protein [Adhaeribacter soli]KAA9324962.1 T9SS type A sorting domain-containing protein [Adhaeribacter soli]